MESILSNLIGRFATRRIDDGREFDVAGDWTYAVFFGIGGVAIAWGLAKTVKAWRDALK